jgi:trehalose/maltose transport system permease protein
VPDVLRRTAFVCALGLVVVWSLFPLWYALVASLSRDTELFEPHYWPVSLYLGNFTDLLHRSLILRGMVNSMVVAVAELVVSLGLSLLAAYPLARVAFGGRRLILMAVLMTTMFPQVAVLAGFYELIRALGLYNTLWAVVMADLLIVLPFSVWLLTAYLRALPRELDDLALIDGTAPLSLIWHVYLPLLWPGVVATGLLAFVAVWNEFLYAFTFTFTEDTRTAPVTLALLWGQTPHDMPWGDLMAASVILTLPCLLLVMLFQRRIVSGLTTGAVSG